MSIPAPPGWARPVLPAEGHHLSNGVFPPLSAQGLHLSRNISTRKRKFFSSAVCDIRKHPHGSGAIFQVRWSGAASGARPRHVRVRVVSRFSALQKTCKNIEMAANASVFQLCVGVVRGRGNRVRLPRAGAVTTACGGTRSPRAGPAATA